MRIGFWAVLVCSLCTHSFGQKPSATEQPNILLLLADDMGYGELGSYGQKIIKTPNLDALAAKGLRFTEFYAGSAVCSPSRAVLMTGIQIGRLSIRGNNGLLENGEWGRIALRKSEMTLAEMLRSVGYQTAFIGKWHLDVSTDLSTWASSRGFDFAVQEQWGDNPEGGSFDPREHWLNQREEGILYDYTKYDCLDAFRTEIALKFLEEQRDSEKPFFLVMSYRSPHAHEYHLRETELYNDHGWPEIERTHAARITMLDEQVGLLIKRISEMGELKNTLILFTSDNGPHGENQHDPAFFVSSSGLKGHKRDLYEGGIRVPMIAYWEGRIRAGQTSGHKGIFYDVMPTLAEVAGIAPPKQTDGISFLPELLGKKQKKHDLLYWAIQAYKSAGNYRQATRLGRWKAVRYGQEGRTELYDLESDLYEAENVADKYPEIVEKMNNILRKQNVEDPHWPYAAEK